MLALAEEFFASASKALTQTGVSLKDQRIAFKRAMSFKDPTSHPARDALERSYALSELISHWQHDKRYASEFGAPKVLPISGRGATLATLGHLFTPDMAVGEIVTALLQQGEVGRIGKDKVALLGTGLIVPPKTAELSLALMTVGCERFMRSVMLNATLPEKHKINSAHVVRFVVGDLTSSQFAKWLKAVRPELQKSIQNVEVGLRLGRTKRSGAKKSGVAMYVFRDE